MGEYIRLARPFVVLLAVFTLGRWLMGTAHVPYERGHHVFSLITLTAFSVVFYGAFTRRWLGYRLAQAAALGYLFGLAVQVVILTATAVSYAAGIDTYFTHPRALNVEAPLAFGEAIVRRLGGVVANPLISALLGCIGWALGGLLPETRRSE